MSKHYGQSTKPYLQVGSEALGKDQQKDNFSQIFAHFGVAFYCGRPKARLCSNIAV